MPRKIEDDRRHIKIRKAILDGMRARGKNVLFDHADQWDRVRIGGQWFDLDDIANRVREAEDREIMIGTIHDRLTAVVQKLKALGLDAHEISIHAHPTAIRPFALCFDSARYPGRSVREIEFDGAGTKWLGHWVYQDTRLEAKDRIDVRIRRQRAITVPLDSLPRVDEQCAPATNEIASRCVLEISPRAT